MDPAERLRTAYEATEAAVSKLAADSNDDGVAYKLMIRAATVGLTAGHGADVAITYLATLAQELSSQP